MERVVWELLGRKGVCGLERLSRDVVAKWHRAGEALEYETIVGASGD